ncbi:mechanosensitive ion channel family protein [Aerosakkonema funiforme]|uniref:mechanosensitive ion channel family protein n=1 Tax=Aerosakkonema funiforme TaxID=1246630 RepID=UPI0035B6BAD4
MKNQSLWRVVGRLKNIAHPRSNFIFVLSFILGCMLSLTPVWAQANPSAAIALDGRQLFKVSQLEGFDAQPRADYANGILNRAVESDEAVQVQVVKVKDLPVIRVNGVNLLTVTEKDAVDGMTKEEQAQRWRDRIDVAIKLAQEQRRPEYIRKALLISAGCVLVAIGFNSVLGSIWQKLQRRLISHRETVPETAAPTQSIDLFLKFTLVLLRAAMWLGALLYITNQFPQTRVWSQKIVDVIVYSLTAPIIPLGDKSYSVIQVIILIALFYGLLIVTRTVKNVLRSRILGLTGMNRGAQEAIATIAFYGLIFIGTVVLLQLWGLDLSSLTIFAGVLGVGIGLGLQGIAKEFVSGLVIIFERPIQVGDFVNVGDFMGTVERISVRSTEIRTLDRVSIIVPNSRFLENEVVNWSHSGFVTRLRLPIGVAYGSDLSKVRDALIDATKDYPDVVSDPPPNVIFRGFGDYSLQLELLVWIKEPRQQVIVKSDLYFRIDTILRDRNIEIPFPQRDFHVRSGALPLELSPQLSATLAKLLESYNNGGNNRE